MRTKYDYSKLDQTRFAVFHSMDAWREFMRARARMGENIYLLNAITRADGSIKVEYGVC